MKGRRITEDEWEKREEDVVLHNIISAGAKFDCVQRCAKIECNYQRKEEKRHELDLHNHEFKVKLKTMKRR